MNMDVAVIPEKLFQIPIGLPNLDWHQVDLSRAITFANEKGRDRECL